MRKHLATVAGFWTHSSIKNLNHFEKEDLLLLAHNRLAVSFSNFHATWQLADQKRKESASFGKTTFDGTIARMAKYLQPSAGSGAELTVKCDADTNHHRVPRFDLHLEPQVANKHTHTHKVRTVSCQLRVLKDVQLIQGMQFNRLNLKKIKCSFCTLWPQGLFPLLFGGKQLCASLHSFQVVWQKHQEERFYQWFGSVCCHHQFLNPVQK